MRRNVTAAGALLALSLVVAACAEGDQVATSLPTEVTTTTISDLGGDRYQAQTQGETYLHPGRGLSGTLVLEENGCWWISLNGERRIVAFPEGFTLGDTGTAMVSPDGTEFGDGLAVDGVGGPSSVDTLPGVPDGYWDNLLSFCDPSASEVVVLAEISPTWDPTALTESELVELVTTSALGESWGCGLGFTLSSHDQRVVLYLEPMDFAAAPTPPIAFPDAAWSGRIVVGNHLLVNHCDDVMEYWEPEPMVAASWELTGGVLEFEPPAQVGFDACGAAAPVVASLTGGMIDTPSGPLELGDLTMVNEAYGCFAG